MRVKMEIWRGKVCTRPLVRSRGRSKCLVVTEFFLFYSTPSNLMIVVLRSWA